MQETEPQTEQQTALTLLGYAEQEGAWRHPEGRRAVFVGDQVDRGPKVVETVRLVRSMMRAGIGARARLRTLWAHARPRGRVAEQYYQPRYRLHLRRQADRAAMA